MVPSPQERKGKNGCLPKPKKYDSGQKKIYALLHFLEEPSSTFGHFKVGNQHKGLRFLKY